MKNRGSVEVPGKSCGERPRRWREAHAASLRPLDQAGRSISRDRKFEDSPLEGDRFEPTVPGEIGRVFCPFTGPRRLRFKDAEPVDPVECGYFVAFGQGRIIEHRVPRDLASPLPCRCNTLISNAPSPPTIRHPPIARGQPLARIASAAGRTPHAPLRPRRLIKPPLGECAAEPGLCP
jgi:hypothetical protein